ALTLKLAHELACRAAREPLFKREVLSSWTALVAYLRVRMAGRGREIVRVLYLDKRNRLIADEALGEGTADWAPIRPQVVIRRALELDSTFLIVAHCHPSSDVTPSQADIAITRELDVAAKAVGLGLHDHVIVGQGGEVVSFKQKGLL
ncbi:MAG: JAB domain-containing protein, partial [Rubrivivax sp.]|nr:JAB domain-containing protein [Rubrivivax sp.]